MRIKSALGLIGLFALSLIVLWQVIFVNLGQHYQRTDDRALTDTKNMTQMAQILETARTDIASAEVSAKKLIWSNPLDGRGLLLLALINEQQGNTVLARNLMLLVEKFYPNQSIVQLQLGGFWARLGDMRHALSAWSRAFAMQASLRKSAYPDLLRLVDVPQYYQQLQDAFADSGNWGESFFIYAVRNAVNIDTLKVLYQARIQSQNPPTEKMREVYLNRLMKERQYTDAYFVWFNSLNNQQIMAMGNLFDGGFDVEAPAAGFAWRYKETNDLSVRPQKVNGANDLALHLIFKPAKRLPNILAWQPTLLDAGNYKLSGRVKLDNLAAITGVHWEIACFEKPKVVLVKTEDFIDKTNWKAFSIPFEIPLNCPAQLVRLVLDKADAARANLSGSVWFDDLAIEQVFMPRLIY